MADLIPRCKAARRAGLDEDLVILTLAQTYIESNCGKMFTLAASFFCNQPRACCCAPSRSGQDVITGQGCGFDFSVTVIE
jgi:hypothetical protein